MGLKIGRTAWIEVQGGIAASKRGRLGSALNGSSKRGDGRGVFPDESVIPAYSLNKAPQAPLGGAVQPVAWLAGQRVLGLPASTRADCGRLARGGREGGLTWILQYVFGKSGRARRQRFNAFFHAVSACEALVILKFKFGHRESPWDLRPPTC